LHHTGTKKPIRVLYDASLARNPAGTGTYVRGLLGALAASPAVEVVTTSFDPDSAGDLDLAARSSSSRLVNGLRHLAYYLRTLPAQARRASCDVIFCPTSLVPLAASRPVVMTIFDLTPLRFASTQDRLSRQYIGGMMRWGAHRSAGICTISRAVATEVQGRFRIPPTRITVTYPGPNPQLAQAQARPAAIPSRAFALMVGTMEPRKNHVTVLRALSAHLARRPATPLCLVLAGSRGWGYGPVLETIRELHLEEHVVELGAVDPGALKWLYQQARALLFPSLYEGFGLPVLEAMSHGCRVVAARIPSVEEITGSPGCLLDPTDVAAWSAALDEVAEARPDPARIQADRERAAHFTWEACAAAAVKAVETSLAGRP
jgi:glycosyltransferase involved in cell wall biosynthesis